VLLEEKLLDFTSLFVGLAIEHQHHGCPSSKNSFACKDYNVDLTGSGEVRVFNQGVCHKFKIYFK